MARYERISALYELLGAADEPMSVEAVCQDLGVSRATAKRLVSFLRDEGVQVHYDRDRGGYVLDKQARNKPLPLGPMVSAAELGALLTSQEILGQIPPGLLRRETEPLRTRLEKLIARRAPGGDELRSRIRLVLPHARTVSEGHFGLVLDAITRRRRLAMVYRARSHEVPAERTVSPIRLTLYRSNWYLAAWCHRADDLRIFSVDRIASATVTAERAYEPESSRVDPRLESAYGIFEGAADKMAVLRFDAQAARYAAEESWHPDQQLEPHEDGGVTLRVPYRHATELAMEVLRYGPQVEVLAPPDLREHVRAAIEGAARLYAAR